MLGGNKKKAGGAFLIEDVESQDVFTPEDFTRNTKILPLLLRISSKVKLQVGEEIETSVTPPPVSHGGR
jgi:hypothetical protein